VLADPCLHANDLLSARSLTLEPYEPSPPSLRSVRLLALEARPGMRSSRRPLVACSDVLVQVLQIFCVRGATLSRVSVKVGATILCIFVIAITARALRRP